MENQKNSNFLGGVTMTKIIDLSVKEKIYKSKKTQISILNDFKLEVTDGEKIAIVTGLIFVTSISPQAPPLFPLCPLGMRSPSRLRGVLSG